MHKTKQAVQIAARLYEAQEKCKQLARAFGSNYETTVAGYKGIIQHEADQRKCDVLDACMAILTEMSLSDERKMWFLAAIVELHEPSA